MKKILLTVFSALAFSHIADAACYLSCTASGQAFWVTTNQYGNPIEWEPAGGCALGPWVAEINAIAMPPETYDPGATHIVSTHLDPGNMNNASELPEEIRQNIADAIANGTVKRSFVDPSLISETQLRYIQAHQ